MVTKLSSMIGYIDWDGREPEVIYPETNDEKWRYVNDHEPQKHWRCRIIGGQYRLGAITELISEQDTKGLHKNIQFPREWSIHLFPGKPTYKQRSIFSMWDNAKDSVHDAADLLEVTKLLVPYLPQLADYKVDMDDTLSLLDLSYLTLNNRFPAGRKALVKLIQIFYSAPPKVIVAMGCHPSENLKWYYTLKKESKTSGTLLAFSNLQNAYLLRPEKEGLAKLKSYMEQRVAKKDFGLGGIKIDAKLYQAPDFRDEKAKKEMWALEALQLQEINRAVYERSKARRNLRQASLGGTVISQSAVTVSGSSPLVTASAPTELSATLITPSLTSRTESRENEITLTTESERYDIEAILEDPDGCTIAILDSLDWSNDTTIHPTPPPVSSLVGETVTEVERTELSTSDAVSGAVVQPTDTITDVIETVEAVKDNTVTVVTVVPSKRPSYTCSDEQFERSQRWEYISQFGRDPPGTPCELVDPLVTRASAELIDNYDCLHGQYVEHEGELRGTMHFMEFMRKDDFDTIYATAEARRIQSEQDAADADKERRRKQKEGFVLNPSLIPPNDTLYTMSNEEIRALPGVTESDAIALICMRVQETAKRAFEARQKAEADKRMAQINEIYASMVEAKANAKRSQETHDMMTNDKESNWTPTYKKQVEQAAAKKLEELRKAQELVDKKAEEKRLAKEKQDKLEAQRLEEKKKAEQYELAHRFDIKPARLMKDWPARTVLKTPTSWINELKREGYVIVNIDNLARGVNATSDLKAMVKYVKAKVAVDPVTGAASERHLEIRATADKDGDCLVDLQESARVSLLLLKGRLGIKDIQCYPFISMTPRKFDPASVVYRHGPELTLHSSQQAEKDEFTIIVTSRASIIWIWPNSVKLVRKLFKKKNISKEEVQIAEPIRLHRNHALIMNVDMMYVPQAVSTNLVRITVPTHERGTPKIMEIAMYKLRDILKLPVDYQDQELNETSQSSVTSTDRSSNYSDLIESSVLSSTGDSSSSSLSALPRSPKGKSAPSGQDPTSSVKAVEEPSTTIPTLVSEVPAQAPASVATAAETAEAKDAEDATRPTKKRKITGEEDPSRSQE